MSRYFIDDIKIAGTELDGRKKLTHEQQESLKRHKADNPSISYRNLAVLFNCSAMEAYYLCNPDKYKKKLAKDSAKATQYSDRENYAVLKASVRRKKRLNFK